MTNSQSNNTQEEVEMECSGMNVFSDLHYVLEGADHESEEKFPSFMRNHEKTTKTFCWITFDS